MFTILIVIGIIGLITQDLKGSQVIYLLTLISGSSAIIYNLIKEGKI